MRRHVVLLGLPGSGKSAAGRLAAAELGAPFVDVDEMIGREAGATIEAIFAHQGEAGFRALERRAMLAALAGPPAVLAPGGGWAAEPGALEAAAGAVTVYLRCDPATAGLRLGGAAGRPLLSGAPPVERLRQLLAAREAHYRAAKHEVETAGHTVAEVADQVAALARRHGGW